MVSVFEDFAGTGALWDSLLTWTVVSGDPIRTAGAAERGTALAICKVEGTGIGVDQYVKATYQGGRFQQLRGRFTDDNNLYFTEHLNVNGPVNVIRVKGGSGSTLITGTTNVLANTVVEMRMQGSTISLYIDDVLEDSVTDPDPYLVAGDPGAFVLNAGANGFLDWEAGDLAAVGGSTSPNALRMNRNYGNLGVNITTR